VTYARRAYRLTHRDLRHILTSLIYDDNTSSA